MTHRTLHNSFKSFIKFANYLGLLPVTGLSSIQQVQFKWKSWKTIYTTGVIFLYLLNTLLTIIYWTSSKFSFKIIIKQLNVVNAFITLLLYLWLAKKWPKFAQLWNEVDLKMTIVYGYPTSFDPRIRIGSLTAIIMSIIEYIVRFKYQLAKTETSNNEADVKKYYVDSFPEIFSILPFNFFTATFASVSSLIGHLIWSYNDLFIILISSALALRFKQITDRLCLNKKRYNSNNYWIEIRTDYDNLVQLSRKLEKYISCIVLLSYSANIFFLLLQLSNVIGHLNRHIEIFYYIYSFSFLIVRLVCVSLYGAWINDESKQPAQILHEIPSEYYSHKIRHFLYQVSFNDVGITGSNMFKVTRKLLLHIAGAIVTYELVMIQFNDGAGLQ